MIVESQNSDNEDADQFVVEAAPQLSEMSELEMVGQPQCMFNNHTQTALGLILQLRDLCRRNFPPAFQLVLCHL